MFETAAVLHAQAEVAQTLERGIIPFWVERSFDRDFGGFLTNFDRYGRHQGTPEKYLNTQTRMIWWFSALYHRHSQRAQYKEIAEQGVEFLLRSFWDDQYEGWYWKAARDGTCLDHGKVVYGQSFAIYALAEYYLATRDPRGLEYAIRTFDLLQKFCTDTSNGGYFENLERDWTVSESGFAGGDRKSLDTHMHLMESYTVLYEATQQELHRRKLLEVLTLIQEHMIDPDSGCGRNQFNIRFRPVPAIAIKRTWNAERQGDAPSGPTDATSFGHNVELAWLLNRALSIAEADKTTYLPVITKLADHCLQFGLDNEFGGVYRDGRATGEVLVYEKEWWQHAEVLVGFLDALVLLGDERYWSGFVNVWEFVSQHMINHEVGEWYTLLDRRGNPIVSQLGNEWKVAYHTGRSMLECSDRLRQLSQSSIEGISSQHSSVPKGSAKHD